jgi:hypothetical protein
MSFLLEMGLNSSEQSYVHEDEEEEDDDVVEVVGASLKRERDADEFDDDDDDVDVFGKKKKKKKSCKPTSNFSIMFDSPSLPAKAATTTATKKRSAVDKNINALLEGADEDENDVEGIKADGKKRMQKVLSKIAASAEAENGNVKKTGRRGAGKKKAAVELQTEPSDDAEVQRLKALLVDLNSNSYGKVRHVDIPLDDLDVEVPSALKAAPTKILTAAEREEQASKKSSSILETILGSAPEDVSPPPPPAEAKIKLKTRMNGKAEWAIKISVKQTFGVTKTKFAPIYGLSVADMLSFQFDGERIEDEATPEGLEMNDDDMLEVRVPDDKFEKAIAYHQASQASKAKTKGKPPAATATAAATPASAPAAGTNEGPLGSLTISIVVHKDASGNGDEQAFKTHILPTTTLFKAHAGLSRVLGLFKENVKLLYFLDKSDSSAGLVPLPMDSSEPLTAFGVGDKAKLLVRREAKPTLTIKVKGAGLEFDIKISSDKELRVLLDAVRKSDALSTKPLVTFTYNGVGISDESQTVEELGIADGGVINIQ